MGPKEGRYKFLSLNKSVRGKKLLVGESVMRNQNIANATMGKVFWKFLMTANKTNNHIATGIKGNSVQCGGKS